MSPPEEQPSQTNPLEESWRLPPFERIRPEHVEPAIDARLAENRARLEAVLSEHGAEPTWSNLVQPLEEMEEALARVWSPVRHLNAVVNSEALRSAYNACLPKLSDYATGMGQHEGLFQAYRAIAARADFAELDAAQQKAVHDALRDFRLSGIELDPTAKQRFKAIQQELSRLQARFEENVLDATHAWTKHVDDPQTLAGLPDSALASARQSARERELDGWLLTLEGPSYVAVMTYADARALRQEVYTAYQTRASEQGPHAGRWDNTETMAQILALRHEEATLLGFDNYAEQSLATKMADSPAAVLEFLNDLARRARPAAERELSELREFAAAELGLADLQPWDIAYASEKLRERRYRITQEELKPYFEVDRVLAGLFELVNRLYGVQVTRREGVETWHSEVRFYTLVSPEGEPRGSFFLDLYARSHKRGGAWMDECANRLLRAAGVEAPVAFMTCNCTPPVAGEPTLLTHDEVSTLFHEFGHALHHMLTQVDYPSLAGINGVEWDAVELPSQLMENWCWARAGLDLFARHWQTGAPLPDDVHERLQASRHYHAGMQMLRQIEFSVFDLRLHVEYDPSVGPRVQALLEEVRAAVAVVHPPKFTRFANAFAHIFAGGYAAGYYGYKWAEVLSADVFAAFEEQGVLDRATGERFLRCVLERGGSRPAGELFRDFRGRAPELDALLRHQGLAA